MRRYGEAMKAFRAQLFVYPRARAQFQRAELEALSQARLASDGTRHAFHYHHHHHLGHVNGVSSSSIFFFGPALFQVELDGSHLLVGLRHNP
jgi:hypothetical protein